MNREYLCYSLAGLNIHIADAPPILERSMHKAFRLCQTVTSDYSVAMRGSVKEDMAFLESMPHRIRNIYDGTPGDGDPIVVSGPDEEFCVLSKGLKTGAYALCVPPYNKLDLCCQKLSDEQAPLHFQSVLIPVIRNLLLRQGKLLMHAGCVATPDGDGLLIIADSGGGKTTTSIALARKGFRFVSDDLVVVSYVNEEICIEGIREPMNVNRETIAFFPELFHLKNMIKKAGEAKVPIDPKEVFGINGVISSARASALMVVQISREGPALIPIKGSSILSSLIKSHTFARGEPISSQSLNVFWPMLDKTKTFKLSTGSDPECLGKWMAMETGLGRFGGVCTMKLPDDIEQSPGPKPTQNKRISKGNNRFHQDFMWPLVRTVLNHTLDGTESDRPLHSDILHADYLSDILGFMQYHRIEVHLARWLQKRAAATEIAAIINPRIMLEKAMAIYLDMQATAKKVFQNLASANIPALMLRGPVFAEAYYPMPYLRYFRDIDVIVRENNLVSAESVLMDLGFRLRGNREYWKKRGELPFSDDRRTIELHWDAYPIQAMTQEWPIDPDDFWNDTDTVSIDGFPIRCLSPNHLLLSSCLHIVFEHKLDRLVRLVDLRQIIKLAHNRLDWDWIIRLAFEGRNILSLGHVLRCGEELIDANIPEHVLQKCKPVGMRGKIVSLLLPPMSVFSRPRGMVNFRRSLFHRALKKLR